MPTAFSTASQLSLWLPFAGRVLSVKRRDLVCLGGRLEIEATHQFLRWKT
jgi:hypothetical protein